jgi:hypothetical protein
MTARRLLAGLALLLAAFTTAACAQVVTGSGSAAPDIQGGTVTSSPTDSAPTATDSSDPSDSPSASESNDNGGDENGDDNGGDDVSPVCKVLDKSAVESAFGTSVSFGRSSSSGCQIQASDGRSMIVAVFDFLKLVDYKKPDSTDLTVAGHPAVKTSTTIIYVARGNDPSAAGLVAAYFAGLRDGGDQLATKILEQVVPKFPK